MTEQEQEKYSNLLEMFNSKGWKEFIEDLGEELQALIESAPEAAISNEQWQYARGMIYERKRILGYENYIKLVQEHKEMEEEMDAQL